jgi:hypothetical protein
MKEFLDYGKQQFFIYLSEANEKYKETVYKYVDKKGK